MDQKTWLWRKRSLEKTIVTNGEEIQSVPNEKEADLENSLKSLNQKLASVLDECSAKDELVQNYEKKAEDALADKHKAEEELRHLKTELNDVQQQKVAANERLGHLNSALKDCMDQLNLVRGEKELRLHDAVMQASKEFEKAHKKREESLTAENSYLSKALLVKEKLIEDLNNIKCSKDAEFQALMTRLDSVEKENAFLRYEFRTLEKELDLRNEEMEYSRRSIEASKKQHLENITKIKKLEAECQRLRTLTRKRMSGPAILANTKSDNSGKKLSLLIDQIKDLEKENKILKECLAKKEDEISFHRKIENFSCQEKFELPDQRSIASSRSWLVSEHEHDKFTDPPECKMIGASEMSLMDDFVEMEKLAIVAIDDAPLGASDLSCTLSDYTKELVPVGPDDWLHNVRNIILEHHDISKRSVDEILGDVKTALDSTIRPEPSNLVPISGYITWKSPTSSPSSRLAQESSNEFSRPDVDKSTVRDEFRKHLGGAGPGTALELESVQNLMLEMEKMHSVFQVEIEGLKSELNFIKSQREQNEKESKRTTDDQIENLKMINEDLDTQLSVTKAKLNDVLGKLSSVEVELDNKTRCCEELERTCLELQLQLGSITNNRYSEENENQGELLQTGLEITKASVKLAECEETILKLGKQLKALGSAKELSVVDKVLSITDNTKSFKQRSSLRDQMLCEDDTEVKNLESQTDGQIATARANIMENENKRANAGALVVFQNKQRGGGRIGFLRKLLLRRKRPSSKNASFYFGK